MIHENEDISEEEIENLERQFIHESCSALAAAHRRYRESGESVVVLEAGNIYIIMPNGNRSWLKQIDN